MTRRNLLLWIAAAATMLAADITGKWKAEFTTPDGTPRTNTFTFKVDGAKVTGSVAGTQDETPIQDGKLNGDDISFSAERPFGRFDYKGKIAGNEIRFKVSFGDQSFDIVAKRL